MQKLMMKVNWTSCLSRRSRLYRWKKENRSFHSRSSYKTGSDTGDYKGLKVDKVSTRVTQKEVDEEIEKSASAMQEQSK